jgi:hypothetical protein
MELSDQDWRRAKCVELGMPMLRLLIVSMAAAASLALLSCNSEPPPSAEAPTPAPSAAGGATADASEQPTPSEAQPPAPSVPGNAAANVSDTLAQVSDDNLQWAASVVRVDMAPNQARLTVKLFGTAGGDPATNGLYTYVAFLSDPHEGWQIYQVGDFLDYRILSAAPGRVDLELHESTMSPATGEIGSRTRRVVIGWTLGPDGMTPTSVSVTPVQ